MKPNQIHTTAVIEGDVQIGEGNVILPYTVLIGPLVIGDDNIIGPHVCIGVPGQDTKNPRYDSSNCRIRIGSHNIIREHSSVQKPCYRDITSIGDDVFIMQGVQIAHDAVVEDRVVITSLVSLAGITTVMEGANIGMGASIHQFGVIGPYSMVAMGAAVVRNVRPFTRLIPGKPSRVNSYAVEKFGFSPHSEDIQRYVVSGTPPASAAVRALTERYEQFHRASERPEYP